MKILRAAIAVVLASCGAAAAADKTEPPPSFEETCFQCRPLGSFVPLADAQRMLESVGQNNNLSAGDRNTARIRGLFRIRGWTPESVVRVALAWGAQLRVHAWGQGRGVALLLHPAGAAYRITQQPGEGAWKQDFRACLASLVATDDRRSIRLPGSSRPPVGAWQIRCQDGALVMTRGNVRVMTVPLEAPARDLYIEVPNDAVLQDLAVFRAGPVPEEISPPRRVVLDGRRPAQLAWKAPEGKGVRFQKLDDGCVELAAEDTAETSAATVALSSPGLFEVVMRIDDATPGTGIALLDDKGAALEGIEFVREGKTQLAFGFGNPQETAVPGNRDVHARPASLAGPRQWFRLVVACGSAKCWISGDGLHWGRVLDWHDRYGSWQSIALYARQTADRKPPDAGPRRIRLRSLQVRELGGLTAAVAPDLLAKAAAANVAMNAEQAEPLQAWTERIARLAPAGISPTDWRYACTLQAMAARVQIADADSLLERAVRERLLELRATRPRIDLLQDAALLWRFRPDFVARQLGLWEWLGRNVLNSGSRADFELYQQAYMETSFGEPPEKSGPIPWEVARDATLLFFAERREAELARMANLVLFWRGNDPDVSGWPCGPQLDEMLRWMNVRPMRRRQKGQGAAIDITRELAPPLNRAANNILSELLSTLKGKQYADAARILVTCDPPSDEGLVPAPNDGQLFISFRTALRLLLAEHRGLSEAMHSQVGPADELKIEQTLAQGDPAAVEALPVQYCGSPAAAAACQWLGDRALAAVDLARAISWYDEGLRSASAAQQPDLAARKRLAAAMLGLALGRPPTQSVAFDGVKVPPQQFEGWVRSELARQQTAVEAASSADSLPVVAASQPVLFQAASFAELDDRGRGFIGPELPGQMHDVDWTWRHLTLVGGSDSLLAVQRERITAFNPAGGKVRWEFRLRNGWSAGPVRPLVCGKQIYIRATDSDRIGVACLDGKTGRSLWLCDCGGAAVSDPLWYRGRLFVLAIGPAGGQFSAALCLVELNPETGDVLARRPIVEMAEGQKLLCECQASWAGNRLVVLVAGCALCTDLQGRILWLRQDVSLPWTVDPAFKFQYCQPAIESDGRLLTAQPGSCLVDCLSLETGQRHWRRGVPGLQRIVDLPEDRLLVTTARGLVALNKTSGEILWQHEVPGMLSALARTASGMVLAVRQAVADGKMHLVFLWIDPAAGRTRSYSAIALEKNQPFLLGPFAVCGDRTWCGFGYGAANDSPTTENPKKIIELRPGKPAAVDETP